jgi:hypothetical protein
MEDTVNGAEVRELLAAIRDALDPPAAATFEGVTARHNLLASRAAYLAGALGQALESGHLPYAQPIQHLAGQALPYQPAGSDGK